jgi:holo-[acyl-carrier protein] synthase
VKILVGTDVQPIDEVASSIGEFGTRYTHRLFTDHERQSCGDDPALAASGLAARFAAKEAVLKILDSPVIAPPWRAIEVQRTESGRPEIVLSGTAAELAQSQGINSLSLSLSHAGGIAFATVVAQVYEHAGE